MNSSDYKFVLKAQKNEITEHHIYSRLAKKVGGKNKRVLEHMAADEFSHYNFWRGLSGVDVRPSKIRIFWYVFLASFLGLSFGLKLMERGERSASKAYSSLKLKNKAAIARIAKDEEVHEKKILGLLSEDRVDYAGSVVLGLNDALVEISGSLVGLAFALQNTHLVGVSGLIIGVAASLSMASSEFLSSKEEGKRSPLKASAFTGVAYFLVVLFLLIPFWVFDSFIHSVLGVLVVMLVVVFVYTFYMSVAKDLSFKKKFFEMFLISLSVAVISFVIGLLVRNFLGVEV